MHEIVDLIANYIFGVVAASDAAMAAFVCVAFSMPFFSRCLSKCTHDFSEQKEEASIFICRKASGLFLQFSHVV